ncbi:UNVERIFIED_CONTAM: hypothetical protein Scaly_1568000 [Sesamum calycinum]|uniref:Uncharacterized protein n=1 Tax=Sesamum calycinum TaxID=2727403 RepID=A0AAW2P8C1_9LAMI
MEGGKKRGYGWAISAGLNAALAAVSAKFFSSQVIQFNRKSMKNSSIEVYKRSLVSSGKSGFESNSLAWLRLVQNPWPGWFAVKQPLRYVLVIFFNVVMWGCYVNSMKSLSSLQATVTNFATNFLSSGLAGFFLFEEALSAKSISEFRMSKNAEEATWNTEIVFLAISTKESEYW